MYLKHRNEALSRSVKSKNFTGEINWNSAYDTTAGPSPLKNENKIFKVLGSYNLGEFWIKLSGLN